MCDFDSPADFSVERTVVTRKPHRCVQCRVVTPAKQKMTRWSIGWEGTAATLYVCQICIWMSKRSDEESPFHICLSTAGDDERAVPGNAAYEEVKAALAEGREPDPERITVRAS